MADQTTVTAPPGIRTGSGRRRGGLASLARSAARLLGVVPFTGSSTMAHTFLSFEFAGPRFVAISVEARKERGERYGPVKGLLRPLPSVGAIAFAAT